VILYPVTQNIFHGKNMLSVKMLRREVK